MPSIPVCSLFGQSIYGAPANPERSKHQCQTPKHATPNSSTDKGITPLHNVAIPDQAQAASVLLEHGTRANQQTNTTLHSLISLCHTEVFKYHDL